MSEFIEFLSPSALSEMEKANAELVKMVANVKSVQTEMAKISTPSSGDASIKQLTAQYQQQQQVIQSLQEKIQKLTEAKQKQKAVSIEEKVVASQQLKIDKDAALAVSSLTGAYQKLVLQRKQAAITLQNLIASEKASTAQIHKAQKEYDLLSQKVAKADQAIGKMSMNNSLKGLTSQVSNLVGAFGISTGIYLFAQVAKDIYQTTKQLQSLDLALRMVSGTQQEFASNQVFLKNLAEQYGIEIKGLTKNFTEFWVASKGKLEAEQIKTIFTSISKSVAVMGLSVQQQDSAFLALQQMMSKGTVQAEELKKQLGNALPGAVKAATMAYQVLHPELKVTEKLFMEQMKAGKVLSAELLPELAKAYEKLYGIENVKRAETLQAAQERLSNSWVQMVRNMNNSETGGISSFFKFVLNGLTELVDFINILNKDDRAITIVNEGKVRGQVQVLKELEAMKKSGLQTDEQLIESAKLKQEYAKKQVESYEWELNALTETAKNQAKVANEIQKNQPIGFAYRADYKDAKAELDETNKKIKTLSSTYGFYKGIVNGTNIFLKEQNEILNKSGAENKKSEKLINIQDKLLKKDYDYAIKMLQIAKKFQEEIFNDEEKTYAERLAAREIYSKISLDLIDAQNNREIAIEKDKANQLLKNQKEARDKDLKANATNIKNGFADNRLEIENRYAENVKTINYNLAQELYKIDLEYLEKTHDLQNQDLAFFKKIQKEKDKLTKETADIYFQMAQERRLKDANDENRSLTQRQASFEAWKGYAEAQLFFDEALAKSNSNQSPEQIAKITAEFDKLRNSINETISPLQKFADETKGWLNNFSSSFASNAGFGETFKILEDDFFRNIDKAFEEGLITREEKYASYFNGITEMAQEAYNFLNQMSQQNFDAEYERLEQQKNISLMFAGDSASARAEIEEQYEQRRKEIARREAKARKQQAIFNIAIDTAQAIVAAVAKSPLTGGLPWSAIAAAIGAAQIAMVSSQQIPQYWKGTDNAEGGLAWTQEKGREIITDSQGRVKSLGSDKGAELTMLSKGDKVFTAEKSAMMFDNSLNSMLLNNGIVMPKVEVSMDTQILGSKLDKLSDTIASKESFSIVRDAKGERIYQRKQNERKELLNNILNVKTYGI
jgi:tape measure domain-containing protein